MATKLECARRSGVGNRADGPTTAWSNRMYGRNRHELGTLNVHPIVPRVVDPER